MTFELFHSKPSTAKNDLGMSNLKDKEVGLPTPTSNRSTSSTSTVALEQDKTAPETSSEKFAMEKMQSDVLHRSEPNSPMAQHDSSPNGDGATPPLQGSAVDPSEKSASNQAMKRPRIRRNESSDALGNTYPEGGLQAWLCVFGAFCGLMAALGIMNSMGVIQSYVAANQLRGMSEQTIAWIFGIYAFLSFFCGVQIGPVFDAKGPRWLIALGSSLILVMWFVIGLCTSYWQFFLAFGVCGGLGTSLLFSPCIAAVGHFFLDGRGLWTGVASAGGALGGVVFPLVLETLFPKIGFAWATRVIGFISLVLLIVANLLLRARLPPKKATFRAVMPDFTILREPVYAVTVLGGFCVEWSLNVPLTYLASYGIRKGLGVNLSYQLLVYINVGSVFGRILPGIAADRVGRFNTMIVTAALCCVANFAIWLPAGTSVPALVVYALIFGFGSGSGIGLLPVCVSQLCEIEHYGRYYATCYSFMSIATLTGIPISGALITATGGDFWAAIVFTGCTYAAGMVLFTIARVMRVGWGLRKVF